MKSILQQLKYYQETAKVSAEFSDLVSVEVLSQMTRKSIRQVKDILKANKIDAVGHFGKSVLYSKCKVMEMIKRTI